MRVICFVCNFCSSTHASEYPHFSYLCRFPFFLYDKTKKANTDPAVSTDSPAQEMSDNTCDIEEASAYGSTVHISHPFPHRYPPQELTAELQKPGMPSCPDWVTCFEAAIKHDIAQKLDGIKADQQATDAQLASFLDQHKHLEPEVVALTHRVRNLEQPTAL